MLMGIHGFGKRRASKGSIYVSHSEDAGSFHGPLPERGKIQPQAFTDTALGIYYFAVYLVGSQVDKTPRDLSQEHLEPELFLQFQPVLPALQGIDKDLAQQAQPGDILFGPGLMPVCADVS